MLHRVRNCPEITPEQSVVPREDLIDEDLAVARQSARAFRNTHAQGKRFAPDHLGCQRKDDRAVEPGIAEIGWLDHQAWPLLAGLRPDARFQVNDVDMPLLRRHD